jgi:hypothetical protein
MAQISRPFQIVLVAFALSALAWFAVLHRPGGASSTGGSSPSVASSSGGSAAHPAAKGSASAAGSSHVYHGPAPGVEGLTRDIKRAHEAAAEQERGVAHPQNSVTHKSGTPRATAPPRASTKPDAAVARADHGAQHSQSAKAQKSHTTAATGATAASILHRLIAAQHLNAVLSLINPALRAKITGAQGVFIGEMKTYLQPASQATVAAELHHGKTVLLLFLNPSSYDDDATAIETVVAAQTFGHPVAVHFAEANQVNSFGSITRDIQVYRTPTLLIVTPKRQVTTLTGLTDAYAIKQAMTEARG